MSHAKWEKLSFFNVGVEFIHAINGLNAIYTYFGVLVIIAGSAKH